MQRLFQAIAILFLVAVSPTAAAWLVTQDGQVIETSGDWKLDGSLVVFKSLDGRLSSLRASSVDLEASRARSEAPPPEPTAGTLPRSRHTVLVLTDDDVGHVRPLAAAAKANAEKPAVEGEPPAEGTVEDKPAGTQLEVVDWQERVNVDKNTLEVFGSVTNRGPGVATSTRLEVRLLDRSGELLERRRATLREAVVKPGDVVAFTASFPGSPGFAEVEFDIRNRGFQLRSDEAPSTTEAPADQ